LSGRRAPGGASSASKFSQRLFPCLARVEHLFGVRLVEREIGGLDAFVVACHAVRPTSSRAGVAAVARAAAGGVDAGVAAWFADSVAEIVAINAIDPQAIISVKCFCRMRIGFPQVPSATLRQLFRATPVLRLAGMAELRIRAVLQQNIGPCLVVQNAAETIAETRRGEARVSRLPC